MTLDPIKVEMYLQQMRERQNLARGIGAGAVAAVLSAFGWVLIALITRHHLGLAALGVGYVVGYAIREYGLGMEPPFRVAGALLSLLGCLLGDVLELALGTSLAMDISVLQALHREFMDRTALAETYAAIFRPMEIIFFCIAAFEGYKFSRRKLRLQDMKDLTT